MEHLVVENPSDFEGLLTLSDDDVIDEITEEEYAQLVERHRAETCYDLEKTTEGVTAKINMSRKNVVFFSISYNDSWKAYVDGTETEAYKVNNGMIGVIVPEGEHEIELAYTVKGFTEGVIICIVSTSALVCYIIVCKRKDKKVCP